MNNSREYHVNHSGIETADFINHTFENQKHAQINEYGGQQSFGNEDGNAFVPPVQDAHLIEQKKINPTKVEINEDIAEREAGLLFLVYLLLLYFDFKL